MLRLSLFLLTVLLFSCVPQRGTVNVPPSLSWNNFPKPFKGKILVSTFEVPFKYYPKKDRVVFPITFMGFVSYRDKTLRLGRYKISLPLELWRILKHRLVKRDCTYTPTADGYLFSCKGNGFSWNLLVGKNWKPIKGEICDQGGCYDFTYKGNSVSLDYYGYAIVFEIQD